MPHVGILATLAVAVISLGVFQIGDNQLGNRNDVGRGAKRRGSARRQPLGYQPIIFELAGLRAVGTEIVASAVDHDKSLPAGSVPAVLGDGLNQTWHSANLLWNFAKRVCTRLAFLETPHYRTSIGNKNYYFGRVF